MEIDTDSIIDAAFAWDLSVKVGGKSFATRPLTLADEMAFSAACQSEDNARLREVVACVLQCEPVDLPPSTQRLCVAFVTARVYAESSVQKNFRSIVSSLRDTIGNKSKAQGA